MHAGVADVLSDARSVTQEPTRNVVRQYLTYHRVSSWGIHVQTSTRYPCVWVGVWLLGCVFREAERGGYVYSVNCMVVVVRIYLP